MERDMPGGTNGERKRERERERERECVREIPVRSVT